MYHDKNNEILKKLMVMLNLNAKGVHMLLCRHDVKVSFKTVRGWLYDRSNRQYRKMPYNMLMTIMNLLIDEILNDDNEIIQS